MKKKLTFSRLFWLSVAIFAASLVIVPLLSLTLTAFSAQSNIWPHLLNTMLPLYSKKTFTLMLGVGLLSAILGVLSAYALSRYQFFGRRFLSWGLILPLSIPTYLIAYVYTDLLEYAGPVQGFIRHIFDFKSARDYPFFEIRSMQSAIVTFSLVLYPYIYLVSRAAFLEQSKSMFESAKILGASPFACFWRVSLPLARPAIVVGVMLVLMEVLNDYGAVQHFAIQTFSAGIYDYWLLRDNMSGAAQIALMMLSVIVVLILLEQISRKKQALFYRGNQHNPPELLSLSPLKSGLLFLLCFLPILLGFFIPLFRLIYFAVFYFHKTVDARVFEMAKHSLLLSFAAAFLCALLSLFLAYARRLENRLSVHILGMISGLGYAIPGAVLAIGVLVPLGALDHFINHVSQWLYQEKVGLVLSGSVFVIVLAYVIRFMAVSQGTIYAGLQKITPSIDESAQILGATPIQRVLRIHLPLLNKSILTAMLIVFVDGMKELPATLILRPFNFDTLATQVFQYASDEMLEKSAPAALIIIAVGLLPVILLNKSIK